MWTIDSKIIWMHVTIPVRPWKVSTMGFYDLQLTEFRQTVSRASHSTWGQTGRDQLAILWDDRLEELR